MSKAGRRLRNPGPSWGYPFLAWADRWWPKRLFDGCVRFGSGVALFLMVPQRRASKEYLERVLDGPVGFHECLIHFNSLAQSLILKLRLGRENRIPDFHMRKNGLDAAFVELVQSERPALFGTFHVGHSDLTGCMLGQFGRRVRMVRQRVGNAYDLKMLERVFGKSVEFVWINEGESMLFALKSVVEDGASLALQCDREEHGSRHHVFDFLGARRRFPVTIYHLSYLFSMPVVFSFGIPVNDEVTEVVCSEIFEPAGEDRKAILEAGYRHFQGVLDILESVLKAHPYVWFNFQPLNSEAK